jgi:hypothetical protein
MLRWTDPIQKPQTPWFPLAAAAAIFLSPLLRTMPIEAQDRTIPASSQVSDSCNTCPEKASLDAHRKEQVRFEDLKVRNEQFLAKTSDESAKRKVLSNLLTLGFKIDTEKVYIQAITAKCPACANGG